LAARRRIKRFVRPSATPRSLERERCVTRWPEAMAWSTLRLYSVSEPICLTV
jgi:hypothetical protein